jgi:hypothetical protein
VTSQATELHKCKIGITPFDCPRDNAVHRNRERPDSMAGPKKALIAIAPTMTQISAVRGVLRKALTSGRPIRRKSLKRTNGSRASHRIFVHGGRPVDLPVMTVLNYM